MGRFLDAVVVEPSAGTSERMNPCSLNSQAEVRRGVDLSSAVAETDGLDFFPSITLNLPLMRFPMLRAVCLLLLLGLSLPAPLSADGPGDWYWDSPVNIHWDNHGNPLGKGMSPAEIAKLFEGLQFDMIQVSARSGYTTYPSQVGVPNPKLEGFDTMACWKEVARLLDKRFWVYVNVIDAQYLGDEHPNWRRVDASGNRTRVCNRPSLDGSGWLEQYEIPLIEEIIQRYQPEGLWFDGDWQIPPVCYCDNCKAAWKQATGQAAPPTDTSDANWQRWARLEEQRRGEYKQKLAAAIHRANPKCCYVSNWSWAISQRNPNTAPQFADVLTGDVGAGSSRGALAALRFASLFLSAQEHTPHDVMSAIYPKKIRTLPRMLQEGALVMSGGANWFLWVNRLEPEQFEHLRACCGLVNSRREALGRTHSANPVAVLLSETSWDKGIGSADSKYFDYESPRDWAFALQDAYFGVDVVNEQTLREQIDRWRVVVVANQPDVSKETFAALQRFVSRGGKLIVTGSGLRSADTGEMLGLTRTALPQPTLAGVTIDGTTVPLGLDWKVEPTAAEVLASDVQSGAPLLTRHELGQGEVAYLAIPGPTYTDEDGLARWVMQTLKIGPLVSVSGKARENHLVFSARQRGEKQLILHAADLTTYADGKRIEPNSSHEIDAVRPIPEISLQLPLPSKPASVSVLPTETRIDWKYEKGTLHLNLRDFDTHAAVVLNFASAAERPDSLDLLPAETTPAPVRNYARKSPVILDENFDLVPVGKFPQNGIWNASTDPKTAIVVARDPEERGNRVLKFSDSKDARRSYIPLLTITPNQLNRGRARFSCRIYLEPGAKVNLEARKYNGSSYFTGPRLDIDVAGNLTSGNKKLTTVPIGQWVQLELEFGMAFQPSTFQLKVVQPGKEPQVFEQLSYHREGFTACDWLGIVSAAEAETGFYIDDVRLERVVD